MQVLQCIWLERKMKLSTVSRFSVIVFEQVCFFSYTWMLGHIVWKEIGLLCCNFESIGFMFCFFLKNTSLGGVRHVDQLMPLDSTKSKKKKIVKFISSMYIIIKITFEVRVEPVMLIKFAPASVASALARRVFPVPGGPKSNIPLQGWKFFSNVLRTTK